MQRSLSHKNPLIALLYVVAFVFYSSLSSIYPMLPPMFGVLFVLFSRVLEEKDTLYIALISFCLIIFEANYGYPLFSSIIYFYIVYKFILPKISQSFSCTWCIRASSVLLAYIGYFLFLSFISYIFLLPYPEFSYYIVYYIVIEFFFVSLL